MRAPEVTAAAQEPPPPQLEASIWIKGHSKTSEGAFVLRSDDPAFDGMVLKYSEEGSTQIFDVRVKEDRYVARLDLPAKASSVTLNGKVVASSRGGKTTMADGLDEEAYGEVMKHVGAFMGYLQDEGAIEVGPLDDQRGPVRPTVGKDHGEAGLHGEDPSLLTAEHPAVGCRGGSSNVADFVMLPAVLLQTGPDVWHRGFATDWSESQACYKARVNVNERCSNICCTGCVEVLSCDSTCLPGTPYVCSAGVSGRECGTGEGSCGGDDGDEDDCGGSGSGSGDNDEGPPDCIAT